MKKSILLFAILLMGAGAYAQAPSQMNYQGVARNASGAPLAGTAIGMKLSIHDGSSSGSIVYEETQSATTNSFGLYNVAIGTGTVTSGTWAGINWSTGNKYLEVSLDPAGGTAYTSLGTSQLLSAPYALYASQAASAATATTATSATTLTGTVPMGGDVTGTNSAATVVKLQGNNVSAAAPTSGQVLQWGGASWAPATVGGTGTVTLINTTVGQLTGGPITTSGTLGLATAGTAGTYGDASHYPAVTTDAYGRVTGVSVYTVTSSTGTTNYIPKFTSSSSIGNSAMYQNGTKVGVGTVTPRATIEATSTTDSMMGWFSTSVAAAPVTHGFFEADYAGTANAGIALVGNANNVATNTGTWGVEGIGTGVGVDAVGQNTAVTGSSSVRGMQAGGYGNDQYSMGIGAYGNANGGVPVTTYGIIGNATGGATNYSGYFFGNVYIGGTLSGMGKMFKIDHPLDPANKYLYHSCIESNEMMNIYNGNVTTDAGGNATITLPDYFEALNKDFKYQLTVIGTFAQAIIGEKVHGNKFTIKTSVPNVEVSWMVTGVRHDTYANAHQMTPEVEKESYNKGKYLDAVDFGKPEAQQIGNEVSKPIGQRPTRTTAGDK